LHWASPQVQAIGACNCIQIKNGNWHGFNTDFMGFKTAIEPLLPTHKKIKAMVLGTGGSSKAIVYALQELQIPTLLVSRGNSSNSIINYNQLNANIMGEYELIINTTPLGMSPNIDDCSPIPYDYLTANHICYDVVYNPKETKFLTQAKAQGAIIKNGEDMLVAQAEASWAIWNNNGI
jgi:shikimate dehydrogenase